MLIPTFDAPHMGVSRESLKNHLYMLEDNPSNFDYLNTTVLPYTLETKAVITTAGLIAQSAVNALGFNLNDGFFYAVDHKTTNKGDVYRIGSNYAVTKVGTITPALTTGGVAGDFDANGVYYVGGKQIVTVDVTADPSPTRSAATTLTRIDQLETPTFNDWAFNPIDGKLYGIDERSDAGGNDMLSVIDPATGAVTHTSLSMGAKADETWGSVFFDALGNMYAYGNSGELYVIDLTTGTVIGDKRLVATGPNVTSSDGGACPYTVKMNKSVTPKGVAEGGTVTYTFSIRNSNPFSIQTGIEFTDTLPLGLTFVGGTLSPPAPGTGTVTSYAGSANLQITGMTLPTKTVVSFTIQASVPISIPTNAYTVTNQATLTGLAVGLGGPTTISNDGTEPLNPSSTIFTVTNPTVITLQNLVAADAARQPVPLLLLPLLAALILVVYFAARHRRHVN